MTRWPVVPLGELAAFSNGANFTKDSFGEGVKIIGVSDFRDRITPDWSEVAEVDRSAVTSTKQWLEVEDIVLVRSNGNPRLVGRSMLVTDGPQATHSAFTIRARPDRSRVDSRFLAYQLRHAHRSGRMTSASGTNITNLSQNVLGMVPICLPDLEVQRRVASILGAIDDLIENNRRRIALLEQMAQAIYREWFVRFRYPGHEDDQLDVTPLGDLAPVITDSVDPYSIDPLTPSIGLEHIPRRSFTLSEWGTAGELTSRKTTFSVGDVLFGKIRPYFHKVCVAPVNGIASTDAIVVRPVRGARALVMMTMFSDEFVAHAVATSNGTKMPRADWRVLREWPVPVLPEGVLAAFEDAVSSAVDDCMTLAHQARVLTSLRDLVLPKLVTGTINIATLDLHALLEETVA